MEFNPVKKGKRIVGFNLVPKEYPYSEEMTRKEKEFCRNLPKRMEHQSARISLVIVAGRNRIAIEDYYDSSQYSFKISEKTKKRLENILRRINYRIGYAFETTENNIFKLRANKSKEKEEKNRFPGNSKQRKRRKAKKASRK